MAEFFNQNRELFATIIGGLIGVFGSIATLITSELLKRAGKIIISLSSEQFDVYKRDSTGGVTTADSLAEAERVVIRLGVDFYNTSDIPRSFRELSIEIKPKTKRNLWRLFTDVVSKSKKEVLNLEPYVYVKGSSEIMPYVKLEIINLPSKELIQYDLHCYVEKKDLAVLCGKFNVYFKASYPEGRHFKAFILTKELQ